MTTTITILAWFGLTCATILAAATLYFWALWLWEQFLERVPFPIGLWRATKVAVQLSLTKDKGLFVANYVVGEINKAARQSPEFKTAFEYKTKLLASCNEGCGEIACPECPLT
jgi:hypothetical protein